MLTYDFALGAEVAVWLCLIWARDALVTTHSRGRKQHGPTSACRIQGGLIPWMTFELYDYDFGYLTK